MDSRIRPRRGAPRRRGFITAAVALALAAFPALPLRAQSQEALIRAPVWLYGEPVPGTAPDGTPPVAQIRELSLFVLGGMVYGWKYEYFPGDRLRGVEEDFTLTPIGTIAADDPSFSLTGLAAEYPRIVAWAQYEPNATTARWRRYWDSVTVKLGTGTGRGERVDGAKGIRDAYEAALLNAVRERARKLEKNKPKEVIGEVCLRGEPRLFADAGAFVAELRVLVTINEVVPWSVF